MAPVNPYVIFNLNEGGSVIGRKLDNTGRVVGNWNIVADGVTHNYLSDPTGWYAFTAVPDPGHAVVSMGCESIPESDSIYYMGMVFNDGSHWGVSGWPGFTILIRMEYIWYDPHIATINFRLLRGILRVTQTVGGVVYVEGSSYSWPRPIVYRSGGWAGYVDYGETIRLRVVPNPGYSVSTVSINGQLQNLGNLEFNYVGSGNWWDEFDVVYLRETKIITSSVTGNGAIDPSGSVSVLAGNNQKFTMTPDPGHSINGLVVDGVSGEITNSQLMEHTFYNVLTNHTIAVNFGLSPYDIDVTFGSHGIVEPSGEYHAYYGETKEFVITPDPGYTVDKILVDGVRVILPQSGRLFIA